MAVSVSKVKPSKRPDQIEALKDIDRSVSKRRPQAARLWRDFWRDLREATRARELRGVLTEGATPRELIGTLYGALTGHLSGDYKGVWDLAFGDGAEYTEVGAEIGAERDDEYLSWRDEVADHYVGTQRKVFRIVSGRGRKADASAGDVLEVMRQSIGLTPQQAVQLSNYQWGVQKAVPNRTRDVAWRLLKQRATLTAEHEMALAYNNGKRLQHRQLLVLGLASKIRREWVTAGDEDVCHICDPLHGRIRTTTSPSNIYRAWAKGITNPPAHIRCRCTVRYFVEEA